MTTEENYQILVDWLNRPENLSRFMEGLYDKFEVFRPEDRVKPCIKCVVKRKGLYGHDIYNLDSRSIVREIYTMLLGIHFAHEKRGDNSTIADLIAYASDEQILNDLISLIEGGKSHE